MEPCTYLPFAFIKSILAVNRHTRDFRVDYPDGYLSNWGKFAFLLSNSTADKPAVGKANAERNDT